VPKSHATVIRRLPLLFAELWALVDAADAAPRNPFTGKKHILYTFFGASHWIVGLTLVCSARATGVPPNFFVIIAIDRESFDLVRPLWPNVLLVNLANSRSFGGVCLLKQAALAILIGCDCEVTTFDGDNVVLKNPCHLLMKSIVGCDFMFQGNQEITTTRFAPNIGVYTVAPSEVTRTLVRVWGNG
jgi:hypothetical protein